VHERVPTNAASIRQALHMVSESAFVRIASRTM